MPRLRLYLLIGICCFRLPVCAADPQPNLIGKIDRPLRYAPVGEDFVLRNGAEFFNRPLYGSHTAFRVDGGDKPEFSLYLPGRGGNLRFGIQTPAGTKWLSDAAEIVTRYRPGELLYLLRDPALGPQGSISLAVLVCPEREAALVRVRGHRLPRGTRLAMAFGGVNGARGARDGDIGTENVPIGTYFQFQSEAAQGNVYALASGRFTLTAARATLSGVVPIQTVLKRIDGARWADLAALSTRPPEATDRPILVGWTAFSGSRTLYYALQRTDRHRTEELPVYRQVSTLPETPYVIRPQRPLAHKDLPRRFAQAERHYAGVRRRVHLDTPDPFLNAAVGALNIAVEGLWDAPSQSLMHGAIAWRTRLPGWRGDYLLDALGDHVRARRNFDGWLKTQNRNPIVATAPSADEAAHLARNETGLHTNGDISASHYDMNAVFFDALLRHALWTGDIAYVRTIWPAIERHLAWEERLFRRPFGPDAAPLYEAYAQIWASDNIQYDGGGVTYASAYALYAHRAAARLARLIGRDPVPYAREADRIAGAMRHFLWMPERGAFAEYRDRLGAQNRHDSYGLWTFYHALDSEVVTPREAWRMAEDLARHLPEIPVSGPSVPADAAVMPTTDWMPYQWSVNNVVMAENLHAALGLWQAGQVGRAYRLFRGAILASLYMGLTPGNIGTMNAFDVYRREAQRDFADGAGVMARATVEGLFGLRPDALAQTLEVHPGFPDAWDHAALSHPDIAIAFRRHGRTEQWNLRLSAERFRTVRLHVPARFSRVASVSINGKGISWQAEAGAVGRPCVRLVIKNSGPMRIVVRWAGRPLRSDDDPGSADADGFVRHARGDFFWWTGQAPSAKALPSAERFDADEPVDGKKLDFIDLEAVFNDTLTAIFAPGKYRSPRPQTVSLEIPAQGLGGWAGERAAWADIDDRGLRAVAARAGGRLTMDTGVSFVVPTAAADSNVAFVSLWDNYPRTVQIPLSGQARAAFLLMAGTTGPLQSRLDNAEVVFAYADGTIARLALRNPETWWPIEQDLFRDDYQFRDAAPPFWRLDLATGRFRLPPKTGGGRIAGGAANVLTLPLDPHKTLRSVTVRALSLDVVVGLMAVTLVRP